MARIDVLLATYDGEEHLEAQLDSISGQTHRDWRLIARDDGSSDRTPVILAERARRDPERVRVLRDEEGTLGHVQNFSRLLAAADAPYVALADQDDVWLPDKLAASIERMESAERDAGAGTPVLVFTDLRVVDEALSPVAGSFWRSSNLDPERAADFRRTLGQNVVTGSTVLMNDALRRLATPIPPAVIAHDWWLAATASAFGVVTYVPAATVAYRQHRRNVVGARTVRGLAAARFVPTYLRALPQHRARAAAHSAEVEAFADRFADDLDDRHAAALRAYRALPDQRPIRRAFTAWRGRFLPRGVARSVTFLLVTTGRRTRLPPVNDPGVTS